MLEFSVTTSFVGSATSVVTAASVEAFFEEVFDFFSTVASAEGVFSDLVVRTISYTLISSKFLNGLFKLIIYYHNGV
jgi:hypothetical protein